MLPRAASFNWQPTLSNHQILLRPLTPDDFEALFAVAADPLIWEQHPAKDRAERPGFTRFFNEALASGGAFAIVDRQSGAVVGTTRLVPSEDCPEAVEIGWTFLARSHWGGRYNPGIKKMLLDYAFERVRYVIFYVHERNFRSQRAVEKLGATRTSLVNGKVLHPRPASTVTFCLEAGDVLV
jgi:RimJ/RimL family protein N-acetyltransferase